MLTKSGLILELDDCNCRCRCCLVASMNHLKSCKKCKARIAEESQENEATSLWMDESSEALNVSS